MSGTDGFWVDEGTGEYGVAAPSTIPVASVRADPLCLALTRDAYCAWTSSNESLHAFTSAGRGCLEHDRPPIKTPKNGTASVGSNRNAERDRPVFCEFSPAGLTEMGNIP